ncbi:ATP-binding protein [Ktedonobacter sp. SOSP1-85]|uniref:bifunctional aminoglycoside phosphotransferase/ATP-binding protein n=1 Tax=Ktedonobacter sp. SOSP1-85 TaxID=2778367 RepID=UPI001915B254|nr:ATP-binding protein [Ktedonobacter sp. SOSP1-85]
MAQHHDLAMNFLQAYIAETGDTDLYTLFPFYICYRACVRGKVTSFLLDDPEIETNQSRQAIQEASDLFAFAVRTTNSDTHHPLLLCIGGLMGSGKSTLAHALQQYLSFPLFSSDVIRKQLTQQSPAMHQAEHYGKGTYTPSWNRKTYAALAQRALPYLEQGQSVIFDASFSRREERQVLAHTAVTLGPRLSLSSVSARRQRSRWHGSMVAGKAISMVPTMKRPLKLFWLQMVAQICTPYRLHTGNPLSLHWSQGLHISFSQRPLLLWKQYNNF